MRVVRIVKKTLKWTLVGTLGLAAVLTVTVMVRSRRTFEAPLPDIHASKDPAVIARGRYLAHGAAHCVVCHSDPTRAADMAAGRDVPLSGGLQFHLPVGVVSPPNITANLDTGIGRFSDGQIARALRFGVGHDGRALMPFMPFAQVSDEDLGAIISYLRTLAPVSHKVTPRAMNPLGQAVVAFVLKPSGPTASVPARVEPAPTAEYGRYLVHDVANCVGCHTTRDMRTGKFTGATLAGGQPFDSHADPRLKFVTPNLTDHPRTGRIANWNEEIFVARFRTGKGADGSPMPWSAFGTMSDSDLQAIYRYLKTVPGVDNDTGDSVRTPVAVATAK